MIFWFSVELSYY